MKKVLNNNLQCDFCDKDFNDVSGRYLVGEFRQCWRCQLKEIYEIKREYIKKRERNYGSDVR